MKLIMSKFEDSGFSSAVSVTRNCENIKEHKNYTDTEISSVNNLESHIMMLSLDCNDENNEKFNDFQKCKDPCTDISNVTYEFFYRQDHEGDTRLHATITLGLSEATYWLINLAPHPCLLDIINDDGITALHLAVMARDAQIVRRLLLFGANKLLRTKTNGNTPLHLACAFNDIECVKALTEPITDEEKYYLAKYGKTAPLMISRHLELRNYNGETCLHVATSKNNLEIVRQLLYSGANVNAREGLRGMSALHLAIENNYVDIIWFLAYERPYCLDAINYAGLTTFDIAKYSNNRLADKLRKLRYNWDTKDSDLNEKEKHLKK